MKNVSQIFNLILALALVILVVKVTILDSDKSTVATESNSSTNQTMESILNRASVRSYTTQQVEEEKVELLLRAAMAAPSAVNKQPWSFIVVNQRSLLDQLGEALPYAKMILQSNVAIVVCGDLDKALLNSDQAYWVQDCSAATENLLLAAHSLGLGAVWTGVFPRDERVATVREILNIPSNLVPLNVIPIGYPKGETTPKDKWNPSNINYNKF